MADTATLIEEPRTDVAVQKEHAPAVQYDMENLTFAQRVALDPSIDIERLEKIIAMERESDAIQAKHAFMQAKVAAKAEMPRVSKSVYNKHTKSNYADLAAIDLAMTPVLHAHGFTVEFEASPSSRDNHIDITCNTLHNQGHKEAFTLPWPLDGAGMKGTSNKTPVQAMKSTITFARRTMKMMAFDIADSDDDDGNDIRALSGNTLTPEQANFITDTLKALGTSEEAFLEWCAQKGYGATEVALLPTERFSVVEKQLNYWLANRLKKGGDDATG